MASGDSNDAVANGGVDTPDVFGFNTNGSKKATSAPMVVHKEAYFYKMDHPQRGLAVIFNHEKFLVPHLKERSGTQTDCENLKQCWENIGFQVTVHQDLGTKALMNEIEALSEIDYSRMDCLVVCVLSHGEEGLIYSRDSAYKHEMLWERFTADKCKSLAGKPKLFFVQACQGTRLDPGIHLSSEVDGNVSSYKIPIHADFLFAYSTIPGVDRLAVHSKKEGSCLSCFKNILRSTSQLSDSSNESSENGTLAGSSWYINALCAELGEHAYTFDLLTILTLVNRRIVTDNECRLSDRKSQILIPSVTSRLTRLVKFKKKKNILEMEPEKKSVENQKITIVSLSNGP